MVWLDHHEEQRQQSRLIDQRLYLIELKIDRILLKVERQSAPQSRQIDWTKLIDSLGVKLTVLILLLLGNVKLLDAIGLILKRN